MNRSRCASLGRNNVTQAQEFVLPFRSRLLLKNSLTISVVSLAWSLLLRTQLSCNLASLLPWRKMLGNAISFEKMWVLFTETVWTGDFVFQDELVNFPFPEKLNYSFSFPLVLHKLLSAILKSYNSARRVFLFTFPMIPSRKPKSQSLSNPLERPWVRGRP